MNVLVLGATGFIGSSVCQLLFTEGHIVTGLGRDLSQAENRNQNIKWMKADLRDLTKPDDWIPLLEKQEVVVNCAGALQDSLRDDLALVQDQAMRALFGAAKDIVRIVQISAETERSGAQTPFLATKRASDEALKQSGLNYVILRPSLVVGRNAYGGTALLRALAALPLVVPLAYTDSMVEMVSLDDVAQCTLLAVEGRFGNHADVDLSAKSAKSLHEVVSLHRRWLGLPSAPSVTIPAALTAPVGWISDLLSYCGWRSPLRTTSMKILSGGIASGLREPPDFVFENIEDMLARHPSGAQDLWFARLYFLKAIIIGILSVFWLVSGLIPLFDIAGAANHFEPFMSPSSAAGIVIITCIVDIALGLTVLVKPWARPAMLGMLLISLAYLAGGTILEPALWLDPLGPYVKVLPSLVLTLVGLCILEDR